ncbi:MAG: hypothetical protein OEZ03_10790 [Alphaproteobacteria bacterium]|nr:hypothetical protein [Alphaproteobacteria bacterium]
MLKTILRPIFRLDIDNTLLIALLAVGALWLAWAPQGPETTLLVVLLWGTALLALASGFARASRHYRFDAHPGPNPDALQRIRFWSGAAALLTAAASLFSAGHWVLAVIATIHLFGRLFHAATAWERRVEPAMMIRETIVRFELTFIAVGIAILAVPLWTAFGSNPAWVENLVSVIWWLLVLTMLLTSALMLRASVENPLPRRLAKRLFKFDDCSSNVGSDPVIIGNRALFLYSLAVPPVLAATGMTIPAALAILCLLLFGAEQAQRELIEAADEGRPVRLGWFARANRLVITNFLLLIFSPVRQVSNLLGLGAAKEAADLRAAFGRPQGFVYFLWSESLQRVPYLEQGGLLEDYADHVVERNWRRDVMDGVEGSASRAERRLLARYDVLRKGTPFLVVIPPSGHLRTFRLAANWIQRWGSGDHRTQTVEFGIVTALTSAFGPGRSLSR